MGVYIKGMSKPKSCEDCPLTARDEWEDLYCVILTDDILAPKDIMTNCPLIEIVRCGECKKVDTFQCPMFSAGWGYTDEDFCSEGERRADETQP